MPVLLALAGASRSGKGTCAAVVHEVAAERGLTVCERQLSGPGKQYLASAFRPDITEQEAIEWFEELKKESEVKVQVNSAGSSFIAASFGSCTLQEYMQRMIQGARDRWGSEFWTDKLLPEGQGEFLQEAWWERFTYKLDENSFDAVDIALISDLRQVNEAQRVKQLGGVVIEMWRPDNDDPYRTGTSHITEQRLPPGTPDRIIPNISDLAELRTACREVVTQLLETR